MDVPYILVRSRRKTVCMQITGDLEVLVRCPKSFTRQEADRFVRDNRDWVERHLSRLQESAKLRREFHFADGQAVPYMGGSLTLSTHGKRLVKQDGNYLLLPYEDREEAFLQFLKERAAAYLPQRLRHYEEKMGLRSTGIKITNAKTRWGSCNAKGGICFSLRLMCLPPDCIDYIVVHELAHLVHRDHSPRFYAFVEQTMPDWQQRRDRIKQCGAAIPF